jgi:RimJ/RimL family protein N-acetyltransferase
MVWPLSPSDARGLAENYLHLSEQSRYSRFLSAVPQLSPDLLRTLVDGVDGVDHVALVLVAFPENESEQGAGVGRLVRYPDEPTCADVAVTVDDAWQGRGVATALLRELLAHRPAGVTQLLTTVATDNHASLAMLRRLGPTDLRPYDAGVYEVRVQLPPTLPSTEDVGLPG